MAPKIMNSKNEKEWRRAWEYHKAADGLLVARVNYSMVAQSMLLVSFVTLLAVDRHKWFHTLAELIVSIFGIYYTSLQQLMSRSLVSKLNLLKKDYLENFDPIYVKYMAAQPGRRAGLQSFWIPVGLYVVWAALLTVSIARADM